MKIGYTTYENLKALDFAVSSGFQCLEFTTLPGFSDMDMVADLDTQSKADDFRAQIDASGIEVQSIITAVNPMSADPAVAKAHTDYLKGMIKVAGMLRIPYISTTSGQNGTISLDENVKLFGQVYRELCKVADDNNVDIVFENCLHGYPCGQNIAVNPETWEMIFNEVDTDTLGLEFDPSHLVFQFIDPVEAAREFADKIRILHGKDTEIIEHELARGGIYSLDGYWRFRLPGYGDVDWAGLFQVLRESGFDGNVIIEHEDPVFHGERLHEGLLIGKHFLSQFIF
ncbi:MAG: sugar phosphate isomerase/epimerase family protein [Armatimonadota bacterium]